MLARTGLLLGVVLLAGCMGAGGDGDGDGDGAASLDTGMSAGQIDDDTGAAVMPASIIDHAQWEVVDAIADPLAEHRPDLVECGLGGWYVEDEKLEVDTNSCNYLALRQPSLVAIEVGQPLGLGLYHFDLLAPSPAVAHVAILIDGELLWEDEVAIPGDAQVYSELFESPLSAPAGAEVVFHLHNHGQNTWALQELIADPE